MRKFLSTIVAVCLVLSLFTGVFTSLSSARADVTEGKYSYVVVDNVTAAITGYYGVDSIVNIPSSLGGYPVTSIGDSAFKGHKEIVSLTIPDSVRSIGIEAFLGCSGFVEVTVGKNVATINSHAFQISDIGLSVPFSIHFSGNAPLTNENAFVSFSYAMGTRPTIYYKSGTTGWTNPWCGCSTVLERDEIIAVLQIGNTLLTVNDVPQKLDSAPVIKDSTCYVPIRAVIESFGGMIYWNGKAQRTTIVLGSTSLDLWIGKNTATVNGKSKLIDSTNAKIAPTIINGRTMLPLRFVTENLGAAVVWEKSTQTITITQGS